MKHVIRTQIFDITTYKKEDAFELQHRMSTLFYNMILPVLEKTFDELAPGNQLIFLDKVEIDLGEIFSSDINNNTWEAEFREIFKKKFSEHLTINWKQKDPVLISYSIAQQWLYYMKHGFLPWNCTGTNEEWYLKVLEGLAQDFKSIEEFRELIRNNNVAIKRIVMTHQPVFLMHLVEVLTAVKQEKLRLIITEIVRIISIQNGGSIAERSIIILTRRFWEAVLKTIADTRKVIQTVDIINEILVNELTDPEIQVLSKIVDEKELLHPVIPRIKELAAVRSLNKKGTKKNNEESKEVEKKEKAQIPQEGLYVCNAGLVLLHPFLKRFFVYLGLLDAETFIDNIAKQKAILLLHFLATGNTQFEEHELVVPKCICNYPFEETVDPLITLSPEMLDECDALLREVISQWAVLKSTSPDGLRVSFLQRPGKLYTKNDEPHLLIETNVLDVLLDRLPWGTGMIRLPWMEKVLRVEWR